MPLQTVEPQRLYRQIADQLRSLVAAGEFEVGQRLPAERDLAVQLGVSRPSVREALIALEVEGMIEVRTGSGIYVRASAPEAGKGRNGALHESQAGGDSAPLEWGPLEVMHARGLIEPQTAALAAERASRSDVNAIAAGLRQMRQQARRGEVPREGDEAFHLAIARASGNGVLLDTLQRYWRARHGPLFERLGDYFEGPDSWQVAIAEHEVVLDAIRSHDPSQARRAMQRHVSQALKRYSANWR
jgi:DNA-binding FadR family transcriptional regulator